MSMSGVLCVNLLGLGLGPPIVALAGEHLLPRGGLAAALACTTPAMLLTAAAVGYAGLSAYARALRLGGSDAGG